MLDSFKTTLGDVYIKDAVNHSLTECLTMEHPWVWVHSIILRAFNEGIVLLIITSVQKLELQCKDHDTRSIKKGLKQVRL